jgi:hypothetical protein
LIFVGALYPQLLAECHVISLLLGLVSVLQVQCASAAWQSSKATRNRKYKAVIAGRTGLKRRQQLYWSWSMISQISLWMNCKLCWLNANTNLVLQPFGGSLTYTRWRSKKSAHAAEQERADIVERRADWIYRQPDFDIATLVFMDETWASTRMTRSRGCIGKSERLNVGIPHGQWKTTTFVAGLRLDGIVGPMVLDGHINREAFIA